MDLYQSQLPHVDISDLCWNSEWVSDVGIIYDDRGLTKLLTMIAASDKFRRHLICFLYDLRSSAYTQNRWMQKLEGNYTRCFPFIGEKAPTKCLTVMCFSSDFRFFSGKNIHISYNFIVRHTPSMMFRLKTPPDLTIHVDGLLFEAIPRMGILNPFHSLRKITKRLQFFWVLPHYMEIIPKDH